mgnify:CR=1 FL=1
MMSGSQKVLKVFGILELLIAVYYAYLGIAGDSPAAFVSAALYLVACFLLLAAAKDAKKAGGAWLITLVDLILSIAELGFAVSGDGDGSVFIACIVAIVLNLIAFIAANNVKKQWRNV